MKEFIFSATRISFLIIILSLVAMAMAFVKNHLDNDIMANTILTAFVMTVSSVVTFYFSTKNTYRDVLNKNSEQK